MFINLMYALFLIIIQPAWSQDKVESPNERKAVTQKVENIVQEKMKAALDQIRSLNNKNDILIQVSKLKAEVHSELEQNRFVILSPLRLDLLLFSKEYLSSIPDKSEFDTKYCHAYYNDFLENVRHLKKKDYDRYMNFTWEVLEKLCPQKKPDTSISEKSAN